MFSSTIGEGSFLHCWNPRLFGDCGGGRGEGLSHIARGSFTLPWRRKALDKHFPSSIGGACWRLEEGE